MRIEPLGDQAILVHLDPAPAVASLAAMRERLARIGHVTDVVPGFASIAVHFDARFTDGAALGARVQELVRREGGGDAIPPRTVEIPVTYDGEDLDEVARLAGLAREEVVALHAAGSYEVRMIGFMPGFPYLAGLDPRLHTPRLESPRTRVPAGSVGIGGAQTGVYPFESPGGWRLIGRTALALFDVAREPASLLRIGDRVRFVPVRDTTAPDGAR